MVLAIATALQAIAAAWYVAVYLVRLLGLALHVWRVRACTLGAKSGSPANTTDRAHGSEGVTILRPMLGIDAALYDCLKSGLEQTYQPVQILMCVADAKDPAVEVAERLIAEYHHVNARVIVGPDPKYGINPKVNNLVKGYKAAMYDVVWALDSNICMHRDALKRALPLLKKRVHLVHHLPVAYTNWETALGGLLDETYMLTAHSSFYSGINAVALAPCVTGKSNIYRRSNLDKCVDAKKGEGLEQFAKFMAEDQMISESLWAAGGRTAIAPDAAVQPLGPNISVKEFWRRRSRWVRLRKYMVTSATLVEPFTDCVFGTAFFVFVCRLNLRTFMLLCLLWLAVDYWNYRVLLNYTPSKPRPLGKWAFAWTTREFIAFPLWLWAMSGRRIWWRNHYYKIKPDLEAISAD